MLRTMRQGSRWIMWIVILGVGAVFVLYLGIGGGFSPGGDPDAVVAVGDRRYDAGDVQRVRRSQEAEYRRVLGDGFDPKAADAILDETAANILLRQALLAREADRLGLRVSDEEVRRYLRRLAGAAGTEALDPELVTSFAEREYGSLKRFEEALRDDLLASKAQRLLLASVDVSEAEARDALRYGREKVSLAVVRLDADEPPADFELEPDAVQALLDAEPELVREQYEARRDEFDRPEEVRARHILIRIPEDADEAVRQAARERAEAALARIQEGADFEDVALEVSEDPGSQSRGGDLGFFSRGRMVKPFEEAAFSLPVGEVSGVVETVHGLHLIRVEEKRPERVVPYDEARVQIAEELLRSRAARSAARERAEALAEAVRGGASLVQAAREQEVPISRPDPLRRQPDGYVPGVGVAPEVMTAAFALTPEHPTDPRIHEVDDAFVLVELLDRESPEPAELDAMVDEERERLIAERRNRVEGLWLMSLREDAAASGDLVYDLTALQ